MNRFVCESLGKHHDRTQFDCGIEVLNDYLVRVASQDVKRKSAAVFIMSPEAAPRRVGGFYTLCSTSIELDQLPMELTKNMPRYPDVPSMLLGRRARDISFRGIGSLLLADAITRCVRVAKEFAATIIVFDIKNETVGRFYERHGFIMFPNLANRMFLPIATAEKLV